MVRSEQLVVDSIEKIDEWPKFRQNQKRATS